MRSKPLTDEEGEVRELLDEDFAAMRPAREVLPPDLYQNLIKGKQRLVADPDGKSAGSRGPSRKTG